MRIDLNCNEDIERWARRFGVSRAHLIAAVAAAGPEVRAVEARICRERDRSQREHLGPIDKRKLAFHAYD